MMLKKKTLKTVILAHAFNSENDAFNIQLYQTFVYFFSKGRMVAQHFPNDDGNHNHNVGNSNEVGNLVAEEERAGSPVVEAEGSGNDSSGTFTD